MLDPKQDKPNLVIHSGEKVTGEDNLKNFYRTSEGKKCIADGLSHQINVAGDANSVNKQAHAQNRGPTDQEIGNLVDRLQYKHGKPASAIGKTSKTSASVSTFAFVNGKFQCINDPRKRLGLPPRKVIPPWQKT